MPGAQEAISWLPRPLPLPEPPLPSPAIPSPPLPPRPVPCARSQLPSDPVICFSPSLHPHGRQLQMAAGSMTVGACAGATVRGRLAGAASSGLSARASDCWTGFSSGGSLTSAEIWIALNYTSALAAGRARSPTPGNSMIITAPQHEFLCANWFRPEN